MYWEHGDGSCNYIGNEWNWEAELNTAQRFGTLTEAAKAVPDHYGDWKIGRIVKVVESVEEVV